MLSLHSFLRQLVRQLVAWDVGVPRHPPKISRGDRIRWGHSARPTFLCTTAQMTPNLDTADVAPMSINSKNAKHNNEQIS
jgi:hypothetical protein